MSKFQTPSIALCALLLLGHQEAIAFCPVAPARLSAKVGKFSTTNSQKTARFMARKITVLEREVEVPDSSYDPLGFASSDNAFFDPSSTNTRQARASDIIAPVAGITGLLAGVEKASAAVSGYGGAISQGELNPSSFQPVCPASDGFYRFLQESIRGVVGMDKFIEYGPLIAGGLLRVRLELCVVESFFNEAVGPFIKENGISWVLPLHETVETFLAGTIFALATTFILVGSTKLLTVIFTYFDLLVSTPTSTFSTLIIQSAIDTLNLSNSYFLVISTWKGRTSIENIRRFFL